MPLSPDRESRLKQERIRASRVLASLPSWMQRIETQRKPIKETTCECKYPREHCKRSHQEVPNETD